MIILLLLIVYGIVFAFFATQNTVSVPLTLFNYQLTSIPIYLVALGSLLLGTSISWLISLMNEISSSLKIQGKNSAIKDAQKTIKQLEKENYDLAMEIATLKGTYSEERVIAEKIHSDDLQTRPSLMERIRHSFR